MNRDVSQYQVVQSKDTHVLSEVRGGSRQVIKVGFAAVTIVYYQVDWHFAFQTTNVPMAEVVAQLVYLE